MFVGKVASMEGAKLFLTTTDLYNDAVKRRTQIPDTPKFEKDLYKPLCDIFKAIPIALLAPSSTHMELPSHTSKAVKDSPHCLLLLQNHLPISIKGSGHNSGSNPEKVKHKRKQEAKTAVKDEDKPVTTKKDCPDYWSCVSPVEVKTEKNRKTWLK